jgi:prevent-host-death family protein
VRTISAREANQGFSRLLETAARGEEVTITRRGVPVAKLVPVVANVDDAREHMERERRKAEALAFFEEGIEGGTTADWTREELYLERFESRREREE